MADTDLDDDDDDNTTLATLIDLASQPKPKNTASSCVATEALRLALTRRTQRLIARGSSVIIIDVPAADWVDLIDDAAGKLGQRIITKAAGERSVVSKVPVPVGADSLRHLQQARSVIFVSQDPEAILAPEVLAAADARIDVSPVSPALLRKVIRQVSGGVARGVTPAMAALPLSAIISAIRPGLSARACVTNLARAIVPPVEPPASTVPLLDRLPLTADLRRWADDTLADLRDVAEDRLSADALTFGVLEGPPGTGKTLLVRSLAQTAGWNLVSSSVGTWFTTQDGTLGTVARNLKRFVDEILSSEPAIGFLDELDALPDRAALDARGLDWWAPIITLALTEIDRLRASGKRVLLLGATNFFGRLDAALVRPGRLQQRIAVPAPASSDEIAALLRFHLGSDLADADLTGVAQLGLGATPAMVAGWVHSARAAARSGKRALTMEDVMTQILPKDARSPADISAIAVHEAGHALVAHRLGHQVNLVSVVPQGLAGGHVSSQWPTLVPTLADVRDVVTILLAGRAADLVLGKGATAGASGDLEHATTMLLAARDRQGLGTSLIYGPALGMRPNATTIAAVTDDLDALLARAVAMIETESALARKLACQLARHKMLTGSDLAALLDAGLPIPAMAGRLDDSAPARATTAAAA